MTFLHVPFLPDAAELKSENDLLFSHCGLNPTFLLDFGKTYPPIDGLHFPCRRRLLATTSQGITGVLCLENRAAAATCGLCGWYADQICGLATTRVRGLLHALRVYPLNRKPTKILESQAQKLWVVT